MFKLDATVDGVPQLINRLKGFEPDIYKILQKDVRAAADTIGSTARGLIPASPPTEPSHWLYGGRLGFDQSVVQRSIKPGFRTRNVGGTRVVSGVVRMSSPAGALYAASGSKDNSMLGRKLNANNGTVYPRALGPAWTMHVDAAREGIIAAVHAAAERVTNG
jgi:hypothetical protein